MSTWGKRFVASLQPCERGGRDPAARFRDYESPYKLGGGTRAEGEKAGGRF